MVRMPVPSHLGSNHCDTSGNFPSPNCSGKRLSMYTDHCVQRWRSKECKGVTKMLKDCDTYSFSPLYNERTVHCLTDLLRSLEMPGLKHICTDKHFENELHPHEDALRTRGQLVD